MKIKKRILWITQTALFLGLTVASQYYLTGLLGGPGNPLSQLVTGSLVNLFLILATLMCGFGSGFSIAFIATFIAFSLGRLPHVWLIPFITLGNIAIVSVFWLICGKKIFGASFKTFQIRWAFAAILGAALKFFVLWLGVTKVFINFILINDPSIPAVRIEAMISMLSYTFSFPQLATALTGSILAYAIYPVLKKNIEARTANAEK